MARRGKYQYPAVSVDVVIFTLREDDLQVLLVQRKNPPFEGRWAIPGGFVEEDESLEVAARRELAEETGVRDVYLEQLYTFGDPCRDPRGRVITVAYLALVPSPLTVEAGSDARDARWWSVYQLPLRLAFKIAVQLRFHLKVGAVQPGLDCLRLKVQDVRAFFHRQAMALMQEKRHPVHQRDVPYCRIDALLELPLQQHLIRKLGPVNGKALCKAPALIQGKERTQLPAGLAKKHEGFIIGDPIDPR